MSAADLSDPPNLKGSLDRYLTELPVLPTTVVRMLSLDRTSETYFDELVEIVEREPTYAARVLALANSAANRGKTELTRIREAVVRVGTGAAGNVVFALSVVRVFVPSNAWERSLWTHALTVAELARALAQHVDLRPQTPDDAYLCGLLHDIGRFVLFGEAPDALRRVDEAAWSSPAEMIAAETAICGMNHATLGAAALEKWGLPSVIVAVTKKHHQRTAPTDPVHKLVQIVQAADRLDFYDVSPAHTHGEAERPNGKDALVERIGHVLPRDFPVRPERLAPQIEATLARASAIAAALLPHG